MVSWLRNWISFPGGQVQNHWVDLMTTKPSFLSTLIKWVPETTGSFMVTRLKWGHKVSMKRDLWRGAIKFLLMCNFFLLWSHYSNVGCELSNSLKWLVVFLKQTDLLFNYITMNLQLKAFLSTWISTQSNRII